MISTRYLYLCNEFDLFCKRNLLLLIEITSHCYASPMEYILYCDHFYTADYKMAHILL